MTPIFGALNGVQVKITARKWDPIQKIPISFLYNYQKRITNEDLMLRKFIVVY